VSTATRGTKKADARRAAQKANSAPTQGGQRPANKPAGTRQLPLNDDLEDMFRHVLLRADLEPKPAVWDNPPQPALRDTAAGYRGTVRITLTDPETGTQAETWLTADPDDIRMHLHDSYARFGWPAVAQTQQQLVTANAQELRRQQRIEEERQAALLAHLDDHKGYYRYVLFQALPPGEQLMPLTTNAAQLRIGFFEPRVVAYNGEQLAIPLTPTDQNELTKFVEDIKTTIGQAADDAQEAADRMVPEDIIIPTAGLVVETSLGRCCACEPHRRKLHRAEERKAKALARQAEAERPASSVCVRTSRTSASSRARLGLRA
jgi:hypothetical protein